MAGCVINTFCVLSVCSTEGVEWDYYYGPNASNESEEGPVDTKVQNRNDPFPYL